MNHKEAIKNIVRHIELCEPNTDKWHIGVATAVDDFCEKHNIVQNSDIWIVMELVNDEQAQLAKENIVKELKLADENGESGNLVLAYCVK